MLVIMGSADAVIRNYVKCVRINSAFQMQSKLEQGMMKSSYKRLFNSNR